MYRKLSNVTTEFQEQVRKDVMQADQQGLMIHVESSYMNDELVSVDVYTKTPEEAENYEASGGTWYYIEPKQYLANTFPA